uniref:Transforming growth factor alpha n=1 Tax=Rattus norvegicus TaxID=10116 RepID=A0ABK0LSP6_RAT
GGPPRPGRLRQRGGGNLHLFPVSAAGSALASATGRRGRPSARAPGAGPVACAFFPRAHRGGARPLANRKERGGCSALRSEDGPRGRTARSASAGYPGSCVSGSGEQHVPPECCHSGYVGVRCEHADLLAVVAASQKKQAITALVVVSIVALAVLIITCVLIHCCQVRKHCEWCRALVCRHEKPSALLKGRTACCHSETVV